MTANNDQEETLAKTGRQEQNLIIIESEVFDVDSARLLNYRFDIGGCASAKNFNLAFCFGSQHQTTDPGLLRCASRCPVFLVSNGLEARW